MLEQTARVVALGEAGVQVCARPPVACARCERGTGCGGGLISALAARGHHTLMARPGPEPVAVGEIVTLRLPARRLLEAAALAYLLPLMTMFACLAITGLIAPALADGGMAIVALGGLAAGAWCARRALGAGRQRRWQPVAVRRRTTPDVSATLS